MTSQSSNNNNNNNGSLQKKNAMLLMIRAADNLWFGEDDMKRDRATAVSAFERLSSSSSSSSSSSDTPPPPPPPFVPIASSSTTDSDEHDHDGIRYGDVLHSNHENSLDPTSAVAAAAAAAAAPCLEGACCSHRRQARQSLWTSTSSTVAATAKHQQYRSICVIGAGPSGLITVRELLEKKGIIQHVKCYEKSAHIGGVFATAYDDATMTSSNAITAFGCFAVPEFDNPRDSNNNTDCSGWASMWTCKQYCDYLQAFSQRFQLDPYIYTNTEVISVKAVSVMDKNGSTTTMRWEVGTRPTTTTDAGTAAHGSNGNNDDGNDIDNDGVSFEMFDAVCVCGGLHQYKNIPSWCCSNTNIPNSSDHSSTSCNQHGHQHNVQVIHSSEFTKGSDFTGKRVVIIGLGESGSDIALLVSPHAKSVKISVRNGSGSSGYVLSRYTNGEVGDLNTSRGFGSHEVWGPYDHGLFATLVNKATTEGNNVALHELARCFLGTEDFSKLDLMAIAWNNKYRNLPYDRFGTKNHSFLEAINKHGAEIIGEINSWQDVPPETDVLILCTGFETKFNFLKGHHPGHGHHDPPPVDLASYATNHRTRYHHMIDLDIGISLAFIGCARPAFGAVPTLSELSARYWALLLTGERTIGPSARAERDSNKSYEERLFYRDASRIQSLVQYHRTMDGLATLIGCLPPIKELQVHHRNLHARVTHSALGGVQYRLVGDGWNEAAWDALALYPLPEYTRQPRSAFRAKVAAGLFE